MRLFVAIEVSPALRQELLRCQQILQHSSPAKISYTSTDNLHLTLAFLGDTDPSRLPQVEAAVREAALNSTPFEISLLQAGCFPNARSPRILWIGIADPSNSLGPLSTGLHIALQRLGFPKEEQPFSPHITIGRVKTAALGIDQALKKLQPKQLAQQITTLHLFESVLRPTGAEYRNLGQFPLFVGRDKQPPTTDP